MKKFLHKFCWFIGFIILFVELPSLITNLLFRQLFNLAKILDYNRYSKCIECPAIYIYLISLGCITFLSLCVILTFVFVWRKKIKKRWICASFFSLLTVCLLSLVFLPPFSNRNKNSLPVVMQVSIPNKYQKYQPILDDNGNCINPLNGFIISKDFSKFIRIEDGKQKEYAKGMNIYFEDNSDMQDDGMKAFEKGTHTPITGLLVRKGNELVSLREFRNGQQDGDRIVVRKISETEDGMNIYRFVAYAHVNRNSEPFFELVQFFHEPCGMLSFNHNLLTKSYERYYPDGKLENKKMGMYSWKVENAPFKNMIVNLFIHGIFSASDSGISAYSFQSLYYNEDGKLIFYLDMRNLKGLCIRPDGSNRAISAEELDNLFDMEDRFFQGGPIPEYKCE